MSTRTPTRTKAAALTMGMLAVAGTVAGCGKSGAAVKPLPAVETFQPGTCRDLASGLVDTLRITRRGDHGPGGVRSVATDLIPPQDRLYEQISHAGEYAPDVERVTTAIGFLRLRVDSGSYDQRLLTEVTTATEALVRRCTPTG
ncbi:hypothetical protein [Frankia sp. Cppng1_Ct_nod]|uniref:hypothetical protein n=1 Tax=Frankia sp. Cppng1_Ct_nod TaxID=2897162 RepID=UPI00104167D4|nr:hypothetical protein [Frankia sp. Cppng1_Ct_nod]